MKRLLTLVILLNTLIVFAGVDQGNPKAIRNHIFKIYPEYLPKLELGVKLTYQHTLSTNLPGFTHETMITMIEYYIESIHEDYYWLRETMYILQDLENTRLISKHKIRRSDNKILEELFCSDENTCTSMGETENPLSSVEFTKRYLNVPLAINFNIVNTDMMYTDYKLKNVELGLELEVQTMIWLDKSQPVSPVLKQIDIATMPVPNELGGGYQKMTSELILIKKEEINTN